MKGKKIVAIGLACVLALGISACSSNATGPTESEDVSQVPDASTSQVVENKTTETETSEVETEEGTEADKAEETGASSEAEEVEETEAVEVEETKAEEVTPAPTKEPVHSHSYTSSVTKEATCDTNGIRTHVCSCGDSYTESIKATGHTYNGGEVVREATCTEAGGKVFTCTKCGAVYTEAISAKGHNYVTQQGTSHTEQVQVGTKTVNDYATVTTYGCNACSFTTTNPLEMDRHNGSQYETNRCTGASWWSTTKNTIVGTHEEPMYETRTVWTVGDSICTVCGHQK